MHLIDNTFFFFGGGGRLHSLANRYHNSCQIKNTPGINLLLGTYTDEFIINSEENE